MNDQQMLVQLLEKFKALQKRLDKIDRLETPPIVARYQTNAGQSIASGSTPVVVNFEDVAIDTHSAVTTGASWHFTAPVGGPYAISSIVTFTGTTGWADTELGTLYTCKNAGATTVLDYKDDYGSASSVYMSLSGSDIVYMAAGDTLDVRVIQTSGAALALLGDAQYNYVAIFKI
jgi:hypothetical protein